MNESAKREDAPGLAVNLPPHYIGAWLIGDPVYGIQFPVTHEPRWLTRIIARALLEWRWKDGWP